MSGQPFLGAVSDRQQFLRMDCLRFFVWFMLVHHKQKIRTLSNSNTVAATQKRLRQSCLGRFCVAGERMSNRRIFERTVYVC